MPKSARLLACCLALAAGAAHSQQPPAAPPAFAAPNLNEAGVRSMAAACATCHGTAGRTVPGSSVASLAGRSRDDLVSAMQQFRAGTRPATIMHQIAKGYSDAETAALADHFAKQK